MASSLPPGWPYTTLSAMACAQEGSIQSSPGDPTAIQFLNSTQSGVIVYRLDEAGLRQFIRELQPYEGFLHMTETTHPFVVTTDTNVCLGIFMGATNMSRAVVRSP